MIVSLTAYNRPDYLRKVVHALIDAESFLEEPLHVVARVEPSKHSDAIMDMLDREGWHALVNETRKGLQQNTWAVLCDAWAYAAEESDDFVLHLEDDFVISPDGLRLAAWMRDKYRHSGKLFTGLGGTRMGGDPSEIRSCSAFSCAAWGTWQSVWEKLMKPTWPHGKGIIKEGVPAEWAYFVDDAKLMRGEHLQVVPVLGRVTHIGIEGTHSTEAHYVRGWRDRPFLREPYTGDYSES